MIFKKIREDWVCVCFCSSAILCFFASVLLLFSSFTLYSSLKDRIKNVLNKNTVILPIRNSEYLDLMDH